MSVCALYFPDSFADKNWAGLTYAIESVNSKEGLSRSGEWLLGRHPAADLTFAIKDVSRRHAVVGYSYANNRWTIADLGSATGTRVRGKAIEQGRPEPINVGDRIWLGANQIIVVEDEGDTVGKDEVGESTIADTKPLDHRPQVEPPAPPILHPPPPPPAPPILLPPPPKTYADTLYLALQWCITPTTALGVAVRLVLAAVATMVLVLWLE